MILFAYKNHKILMEIGSNLNIFKKTLSRKLRVFQMEKRSFFNILQIL